MSYGIGLSGAHRTGKTTLARAVAERNKITFLETSASAVFKAAGLDPARPMPLVERIAIQEALLRVFTQHYAAAERKGQIFVTDRTPIDLAAYLLADVQQCSSEALTPGVLQFASNYVTQCIDTTDRFFGFVFVVQPGIKVVEAEGKARGCPIYMEHLNSLILGLCADERMGCASAFLPRYMTDLQQRAETVRAKVIYTAQRARDARANAGVVMH